MRRLPGICHVLQCRGNRQTKARTSRNRTTVAEQRRSPGPWQNPGAVLPAAAASASQLQSGYLVPAHVFRVQLKTRTSDKNVHLDELSNEAAPGAFRSEDCPGGRTKVR